MAIIKDRDRAVRLARTLVIDLRFCHQDRVRESREQGNLLEVMAEEIAEGLERFTSRVSKELDAEAIFHQAIEDLLVRSPEEVQHQAEPEEKAHCCPRCRLIQAPAGGCTYCYKGTPLAVRSYRWASINRQEERRKAGRSFVPAILSFLAVVLLLPAGLLRLFPELGALTIAGVVTIIVFMAAFGLFVWILKRKAQVAINVHETDPRRFLPGRVSPRAEVIRGVVWRLSGTTSTYLDKEECLAAALLFYQETPENLYYWSMRQVDFLVESEDSEDHHVLIREGFWLDPQGARITGQVPGADAKGVLKSLGIKHPGLFEVPGHEMTLRDGDSVEAYGVIQQMVVPELAGRNGLRGGGHCSVLIGGPDTPLVVRVVEPRPAGD